MTESADNWPYDKYQSGPPKHMHALGVVSMNYNQFESGLFALYRHALQQMKVPVSLAWQIYSALPESKLQTAITNAFEAFEKQPEVFEHLEWLFDYFNKCSTNRNTLLHALHGDLSSPNLDLRKHIKGNWGEHQKINLDLPRIRRVADEINDGIDYLFNLYLYLQRRDGMATTDGFVGMIARMASPVALPSKPPLPRILETHVAPRN